VEASGAEIVTVAIRRTNIGQNRGEPSLLEALPPSKFTYLPNTAGCYSAEDAVRTLRLARELLDGHKLVKLEVLGDPQTLYPNVVETLAAAKTLVADGFDVMVYTSDDPIIARQLEEIGCCAVMPLASLIGSGMGILNPWNLQIIIANAKVPVLVDAGVGTASDAAIAMELGCDGVLMNTAIALAQDPVRMARAMKLAVEAGREAFLAGRMPKKLYSASPSSPTAGLITPTAPGKAA
jgi:thiazole synthase